ncbi:SGNH/GDSL hydrolase family protein [Mesorhizobium sp. L-8-3]|uniref:SGNH/GDSL hydrolase family protein n=1 Tax=Mesorhizobium sp. L-8-3 TaxID=2744522 RepID=UPI00193740AE|nr:DUF459 domain-containing protein [Mesorhizobium sp. L-8-3]BCH23062.1 hypothetical protein MesoLjLb_28470 [Mesorhizobium sp. L-8-3]
MPGSRKGWRLSHAIPVMLVVLTAIAIAAPSALAQEQQRRPRNLLELLFGRSDRGAEQVRPQRPAAGSKKTRKKSAKVRPRPSPEPEIVVVDKSQTAQAVLVVGDFMGSGLAEGLEAVFAENPEVRVIDRTKGSSGFVRSDYYDWPTEVEKLIDEEKPVVVVAMLGSNDRQQMRVGTTREAPLSESWTREYQARALAFAAAVSEREVPLIWVGQPSFQSKKMLSDMLALNGIYSQAAEAAEATFVDIWDGFVDENGAYVASGPDINGQAVRLRSADGINLSKAGKRKVAFYTEKPLNKILGLGAGAAAPGIAALPDAGSGSAVPVDRTPPIALDDPQLDGGSELLGQKIEGKGDARNAAERLAIEGLAPAPTPGRADDFGQPATPSVAAAAPPAAPTATSQAATTSGTRR